MSAFFPSTGVSPDVSGDDEDDDEGGGCPCQSVNQIASMVMYTFTFSALTGILVSGPVHATPEKYENGVVTLKTH